MKTKSTLPELEKLGFALVCTGGNCTAFVKEIGHGLALYVTTELEALAPETKDEAVVLSLLCDRHSESLTETVYPSVSALLATLEPSFSS